jgi:signal peptidase I
MIVNQSPNRQSQHYIKRLCGLPGDQFEIRQPELFINGERAQEPGIIRVMETTGYRNYNRQHRFNEGTLQAKEYLALGDNSPASWDSRGWGAVPEGSLVGPALFVYWPFGHHWGFIN